MRPSLRSALRRLPAKTWLSLQTPTILRCPVLALAPRLARPRLLSAPRRRRWMRRPHCAHPRPPSAPRWMTPASRQRTRLRDVDSNMMITSTLQYLLVMGHWLQNQPTRVQQRCLKVRVWQRRGERRQQQVRHQQWVPRVCQLLAHWRCSTSRRCCQRQFRAASQQRRRLHRPPELLLPTGRRRLR